MLIIMNLFTGIKNIFISKPGAGKRVFVGVSGGVDSSVAAAILIDQGYEVTGVFIRTWTPEWLPCTWRSERRDAIRVCAHLQIPFVELDLSAEYKQGVADYMISEYARGRTPNPDVMCNREVKFGGFLNWALEHGADYIATGHYARAVDDYHIHEHASDFFSDQLTKEYLWRIPFLFIKKIISHVHGHQSRKSDDVNVQLKKGIDPGKDQSYFLWTLTQQQLKNTLFPIGHLPKSDVRELAKKYNLPTAVKKDSQGICFIGMVDMKEFLKHYIEVAAGDVLDTDGRVIGHHEGAVLYTLGERHGFTITEKGTDDRPYYVIAKDFTNNTITVSQDPAHTITEQKKSYILENTIWRTVPTTSKSYTAHVRYHGEDKEVTIITTDHTYTAEFTQPDYTVAPGQSIVVYDGDVCMGGGIVK